MIRVRRGLLAAVAVLLLSATACSSDDADSAGDAGPGDTSGSSAPQVDPDAPLDFAVVETAVKDLDTDECVVPLWGENSTGAEGQVDFRQYDCWPEGADPDSLLGGIPDLLQTVVWVEFATAAEARAYAEDQLSEWKVLVAGPNVLVVNPAVWGSQVDTLVSAVQDACGCGVVRA